MNTITELEAALAAAVAERTAAAEAVHAAELVRRAAAAKVSAARQSLDTARCEADAKLPQATLRAYDWQGYQRDVVRVAIIKRTAKEIRTRWRGTVVDRWRRDKFGTWREYPKPTGRYALMRTLEVSE